jgi:hypothetical protein
MIINSGRELKVYSISEVGRALGLRRVSAGQCEVRGEKILEEDPELRHKPTIS